MKFTDSVQDGVVIITISGKIKGGPEATMFHGKVHKHIANNHLNFIIDCEKVDFMDSVGLGLLISSRETIMDAQGHHVLCNISPIEATLKITRLISVFEHYSSLEEAKTSFKQ